MIDFNKSSAWIDFASITPVSTSGQLDFETISELPSFSHISSAMCGANGDSIVTLVL